MTEDIFKVIMYIILSSSLITGTILLVCGRCGNTIGRINKVTLRWARLALGWVTVYGRQTTSVYHQATQANRASYPQWDGK